MAALWRFLAFFTLLTNLVVAVLMTVSALATDSRGEGLWKESAPGQPGSCTSRWLESCTISSWLPPGTPRAGPGWPTSSFTRWYPSWFVDRLVFARKDTLRFRSVPFWLIYPVGYAFCALGRGAADGFYPYPFVDVTQLGYTRVLVNIVGLAAAFVIGSVLLIAGGGVLPRSGRNERPRAADLTGGRGAAG